MMRRKRLLINGACFLIICWNKYVGIKGKTCCSLSVTLPKSHRDQSRSGSSFAQLAEPDCDRDLNWGSGISIISDFNPFVLPHCRPFGSSTMLYLVQALKLSGR